MRIYDHQGSLLSPGKSPAIPDYETWAEFVSEIAKQMKANGEGPFRKETLPAEFGKVLGPIFILIGIILVIAGIRNEAEASERCDQQHREWMEGKRNFNDLEYGPPRGFFMVGGGGFAIVIGFGMLDSRSRNQPLLL